MNYWRIAPDPRLRAFVACYWIMDGARTAAPSEELMLPDGQSEIVFYRARGEFERWALGARDRTQRMSGSYLIGGRTRTVGTRSDGALKLAGVKLDSRFLRALIRAPLADFRDTTLSFADLGDPAMLALEAAVSEARSPQRIAALLDHHLLGVSRDFRTRHTVSDALLHRIVLDHGTTPILEWARHHRVDPRTLERGFGASFGMTPKQFARVTRFKHVWRRIGAGTVSLDGFYDQSHFNREFRHFTGVAPGVKLAGRMTQGTLVADHLLVAETALRHAAS